jgi:hypothetical protein
MDIMVSNYGVGYGAIKPPFQGFALNSNKLTRRIYIDIKMVYIAFQLGLLEREPPKLFGVIPSDPECIRVDPVWWVWGGGTINHSVSYQ